MQHAAGNPASTPSTGHKGGQSAIDLISHCAALAAYGLGIIHYSLALGVFGSVELAWAFLKKGVLPPQSWWIVLSAGIGMLFWLAVLSRSRPRWQQQLMIIAASVIATLSFVYCLVELIPRTYALRLHGSPAIGDTCAVELATQFLRINDFTTVTVQKRASNTIVSRSQWNGGTVSIEIESSDTWKGVEDLAGARCDIAMAAGRIPASVLAMTAADRVASEKTAAILTLGDIQRPETEHVLGLDGVAVIGNLRFGAPVVEKHRLHDILVTGKVVPFTPPSDSEVFGTFSEFVYGSGDEDGDNHPDVLKDSGHFKPFLTSEKLMEGVAKQPDSIGIVPVHEILPPRLVPLDVFGIVAAGDRSVVPTIESVRHEDYAFSQRLYLYTTRQSLKQNEWVGRFIEFCLCVFRGMPITIPG